MCTALEARKACEFMVSRLKITLRSKFLKSCKSVVTGFPEPGKTDSVDFENFGRNLTFNPEEVAGSKFMLSLLRRL